ncbi:MULTISPECIES: methyltransferase [unclassified Carboxylicivirga]|uniref:methyltransferase n=1 Tax=Carboxylicivirga TaxID=1628153 RepID=UPI003D344AA1
MKPEEIQETAVSFQKSRILLTAYELNIFSALGKEYYSAASLAEQLNLNEQATERLLNALVAMELLIKNETGFGNTTDSWRYLAKESDAYMSGLMHTGHLWHTWSELTDVIRSGQAAHTPTINERGEEWLKAFIRAMHFRGMKQAPSQVANIDLENTDSVLDVGGGSGVYSMALIKQKPSLRATVFDLPSVAPIAKDIIENEGFTGKIRLHEGDYTQNELPTGFDLTFLSAIIHSNTADTNKALLLKCYKSLNPGGRIVIQDWIMNTDKTEPLQGAIFSINMLVGVKGGDCYSTNEVSQWMKDAGFTHITKHALDRGLSQMTATKPRG